VLSAEQELDRLDTAIETLESTSGDAVWSIETRYHEVADEALARGFDMVNDICGFADPEMPRVCREHDAAVSKMASPPDLERPGAIEDVDEIYEALSMNGLTDKTILDPAFGGWSKAKPTPTTARRSTGYGSSAATVARCSSRSTKSFLKTIAGRSTEEALPVSLAATSMAVERGAHVIRTHDVAETRDAALVGAEFARDRVRSDDGPSDIAVEELDVTTVREAERHLDRLGRRPVRRRRRGRSHLRATRAHRRGRRRAPSGDRRARRRRGVRPRRFRRRRDRGSPPRPPTAGAPTNGESGLLVGTVAALSAVRSAVSGVSDALDAALESIDDGSK